MREVVVLLPVVKRTLIAVATSVNFDTEKISSCAHEDGQ
jgi:hypothetical protein